MNKQVDDCCKIAYNTQFANRFNRSWLTNNGLITFLVASSFHCSSREYALHRHGRADKGDKSTTARSLRFYLCYNGYHNILGYR